MRLIHTARCIESFPKEAGHLLSGELTLTAAAMISRILTEEKTDEIILHARGRYTREVGMIVPPHRQNFMLRDRVQPVCVMVPDVNENDSSRFPGAGKNLNRPVENKFAGADASRRTSELRLQRPATCCR